VVQHFAAQGFDVRPNDPYKGGYITAHHGRPSDGVHAIQIELRRDLYMDEERFVTVEPGVSQLRAVIAALLGELETLRLTPP
jgi:N-formylglutamate deformylase